MHLPNIDAVASHPVLKHRVTEAQSSGHVETGFADFGCTVRYEARLYWLIVVYLWMNLLGRYASG